MKYKRLTDQEIQLMIKDRQDGMRTADMAKKYGVSKSTVNKYTSYVLCTLQSRKGSWPELWRQWDYLHERYGRKEGMCDD